jgi:two-component system sensor histidine kinase BaeS
VRWRRGGLAVRIAALGIGIAVITGVLAGGLAIGLIRNADAKSARHTLAQLADAAARASDTAQAQARTRRTLQVIAIRYGHFGASGPVVADAPIARLALTPAQLAEVRAGGRVSSSTTVLGSGVYVEARPLAGGGGIVLAERHGDAAAAGNRAVNRILLAILIGVVVAAIVGVLVARRLVRPLRRTAQAAHDLAAGRRDVTVTPDGPAEVAEVADAVNILASALNHSESRQRDFLLSVSHDLRTPLTAITGYAESLANGVVPADQTGVVGGVMLAESHRLTRLVTDLLDLARLDAYDFRVELADVDVRELVIAAGQVWHARCARSGVVFGLQPPPGPLPARTDAARVRQILDGLLENALRMTPAGAPIVLAAGSDAAGAVVVEVRDGGPGLSDDDLAVAFERAELYNRYRGVRQVGTGLGLAIVHGLTARLGGTVQAGHAPEGGARFTVRLPPA